MPAYGTVTCAHCGVVADVQNEPNGRAWAERHVQACPTAGFLFRWVAEWAWGVIRAGKEGRYVAVTVNDSGAKEGPR